jgi:hypothetical protein
MLLMVSVTDTGSRSKRKSISFLQVEYSAILHFLSSYCEVGSVRLEILKAVVMNSYIFWGIILCDPLKANRRFEITCRVHL